MGDRFKPESVIGMGQNMHASAFNFGKWIREVIFRLKKLNTSKPALQILFTEQGLQCI